MNKSEYLNQLRKEMGGMSFSDIEDIIRDQEEYFRDALSSGRDESQVISSLGDPAQIAKELKAEHQIKVATIEENFLPKTKNIFKAIFALCVLAPFNLIFVFGPFLGLCGVLLALWSVGCAAIIVSLAVAVTAAIAIFMVSPLLGITLFFACVGAFGASILYLCAIFFLTSWFLKMTVAFLKWNIQFITNQAK